MRVIPPYHDYHYFRDYVGAPGIGVFDKVEHQQLVDLSILAYADRGFIERTLWHLPFEDLEVVEAGDVQAIILSYRGKVVVAFRGTRTLDPGDWMTDLDFRSTRDGVHEGFDKAFRLVAADVSRRTAGMSAIFSGHSLGGALATVAALRGEYRNASLVTFGSPMVGRTGSFHASVRERVSSCVRYVHGEDVVPTVPPNFPSGCESGKCAGFRWQHVCAETRLGQMPRPWANVLVPRAVFDHVPTLYAERIWGFKPVERKRPSWWERNF